MSKLALIEEATVRLQRGEDPKQFAEDFTLFLKDPSVVRAPRHVINCSAQPMIPDRWRIDPADQIASRFTGELIWSPEKIALHLDEAQKTGRIVGNDLKKKLDGQPVLPANVLDYLLAHPALIPLDWQGKAVFFWGTVYRCSDGDACVRCLDWDGGSWSGSDDWLGSGWDSSNPSAVLAG